MTPEQFQQFVSENFSVSVGQPKATTVDGIPYYTYRFGAQMDGRDWETFLWDHLRAQFDKLKSKGAIRLIWRTQPHVETFEDSEKKKYIIIRCRVAALDKDGGQVTADFTPEGHDTQLLHGERPSFENVPTVSDELKEEIAQNETLPDGPVGGYNVLAADPLAIMFCAQICHEVNRAYCIANHDLSQLPWADAPDWARASAIKGVEYLLEHPKATPAEIHQSWIDAKKAEGWVYGYNKDPEKKTHPAMMPYDSLPHWQKVKDSLFQGVVRSYFGL